jgi:hypothetical protein
MKGHWLGWVLFAAWSLAVAACGDDGGDDGGGGGCAHAQMVCASDPSVEIDCDQFDSAPGSIKECVGRAATCDAVATCLLGGS